MSRRTSAWYCFRRKANSLRSRRRRNSLNQNNWFWFAAVTKASMSESEALVTDEVSIGDYVLSGGEPAALVVIDAVVRLIPGALGSETSATTESFSEGLLDYPH